jgi:hypothetical protein
MTVAGIRVPVGAGVAAAQDVLLERFRISAAR